MVRNLFRTLSSSLFRSLTGFTGGVVPTPPTPPIVPGDIYAFQGGDIFLFQNGDTFEF